MVTNNSTGTNITRWSKIPNIEKADNTTAPWTYSTAGQYPYMSDSGGGAPVAIIIGAGVGGCALVVSIIALVIYCYMKARKENAKPNMTKSNDIFATAASNTQFDLPQRSRVNQNPDPPAARKARRQERERDRGHVNPAYARHSSDSSSIGSDVDGRDLSPPRIRKQYSSVSSDDSSSVDEDIIPGNETYRMEKETGGRQSYKRARKNDLLDSDGTDTSSSRFRRNNGERRSRRDEYNRNPRSDSPLTIGSLRKHEQITGGDDRNHDQASNKHGRSRRREESPSSRTYESSTVASLTTEGTMTTVSSTRFQKNPSLRRNSPSRSSSHRRYRKDNEKDEKGRRRPRRTRSNDRGSDHTDSSSRRDRSRSPGSSSQRSSSSRSSSRRSRSAAKAEARQLNKEQAMLPIFSNNKKSSAV